MGAEEFGGALAIPGLREALPEGQRRPGVEPRLGHIEQPQAVRFQLLQARIGQGDTQGSPHPVGHLNEPAVLLRDPLPQQAVQHHTAQFQQHQLGQPFGTVMGSGMGHFMAEHRGQALVVLGIGQDPRIHPHLAPRQTEGIGGIRGIEDHELPLGILQGGDCGDASAHRFHLGRDLGISQARKLGLQTGEFL